MLNSVAVKTYQKGQQHNFRIYAWREVSLGETNYLYDSKEGANGGYAFAEEAHKAGAEKIKCFSLRMLDLFCEKWPNVWTAVPKRGNQFHFECFKGFEGL